MPAPRPWLACSLLQDCTSSVRCPLPRWATGLVVLAFLAGCSGESKREPSAETSLVEEPGSPIIAVPSWVVQPEAAEAGPLAELYLRRRGRPVWFDGEGLAPAAAEAVSTLEARAKARAPELLADLPALVQSVTTCRREACSEAAKLDLELRLSRAVLALAGREAHGRPRGQGKVEWELPGREIDVVGELAEALPTLPVAEMLARLRPASPELAALERALGRYLGLAVAGGWQLLPLTAPRKTVHPGESIDAALLARLAQRLVAEGYSVEPPDPPLAGETTLPYLGPLVDTVKVFQAEHGLEVDGNLGKATFEALNVSASERVRQIEVNLERLRWVREAPLGPVIEVNVPAARLELKRNARVLHSTRVIVGKPSWPTPMFEDEIIALVLNPPWNVPDSIAADEILAKIKADPAHLDEESLMVYAKGAGGAEVDPASIDWSAVPVEGFPYRLKQRPGHKNLLGRIKFSLPNRHNVYLHDTPGRSLFERFDRALSHGCVRVEKPFALAEHLVGDLPKWSGDQLAKAAEAGLETTVQLSKPVPVRFLYTTVRVRDDGGVVFYRDLYGLDAVQ